MQAHGGVNPPTGISTAGPYSANVMEFTWKMFINGLYCENVTNVFTQSLKFKGELHPFYTSECVYRCLVNLHRELHEV